eukprot:jgi/Chrzof1/11417/Cz05g35270.t1
MLLMLIQIPEVCTAVGEYIMDQMGKFWDSNAKRYIERKKHVAIDGLAEATLDLLISTCSPEAVVSMLDTVLHNLINKGYNHWWYRPLNYLLAWHNKEQQQEQLINMVHSQLKEFWGSGAGSHTPLLVLIQKGLDRYCDHFTLLLQAVQWDTIHPLEASGLLRAVLPLPHAPHASLAQNRDFWARLVLPEPKSCLDNGYTVVTFDLASLPTNPTAGEIMQIVVLDTAAGSWRLVLHAGWSTEKSWGIYALLLHHTQVVDGMVRSWDQRRIPPRALATEVCVFCVEAAVNSVDGSIQRWLMPGDQGYDGLMSDWVDSAVAVGSKRLLTIGVASAVKRLP